jgi:5-methylcytosine-specific restriction endonuclease McrA
MLHRISKTEIMELIEAQGYKCALTGRALTPETASLDHKTPLARGGKNEVANLQVIDKFVNLAKSTMTQDEFIQLCRDVVNHTDSKLGNAILEDSVKS